MIRCAWEKGDVCCANSMLRSSAGTVWEVS